jgi:hypothetical protein
LTELGLPFPHIELDPTVRDWRAYADALTQNIAVATYGAVYARSRGEGREPMSFDTLYYQLTAELPQAPATLAT